jgi:hypothetical protein
VRSTDHEVPRYFFKIYFLISSIGTNTHKEGTSQILAYTVLLLPMEPLFVEFATKEA